VTTAATWFDDEAATPVAAAGDDHVLVRLGGGRYAVRATDVAEVMPVPVLTRVPATPRWVRGVANWRGHVLPVVDLRAVLGTAEPALPSSARVIVLQVGDVEVGILAEAVDGLLEVPHRMGAAPPSRSGRDIVVGVHDADRHGLVAVLGTAEVLALAPRS
jgi:purine-binding chemotaxis protein CheW